MTTDEVLALSVSSRKVEAYIISKRSTLNGEWALSTSSLQDSQPLTAKDALEDYQSASKSSSSERALHARTRQRRRKRCECLEATDHLLPKSDSIPRAPNKRVARSTLEGEQTALPRFDYSITSTSSLSWYETQTECSRAMSPVTTHSSRFSGSQEDEVLVEDEPLSPLSSQSTISISDDDYQKESHVPDDEPSTPLSSQSTEINSDDSSGWEADVEDEGELVYVGALVCRRITRAERLALNMGWS
ncbi:hypothetical protein NPX13_g7978 [Xylaria arbuscula]|uniref:Uncharacterized protein n=1 Tax=Xylaria arbuscula TaxID=114810 RepID=A0A9W8N9L5_9PEZI|nr:hypothetical protein NPX13_g7978 [Xylaria arbuscula]